MAAFLNIRKTKHYKHRQNACTDDFKRLYRFSEVNVEWLANHFVGEMEETRGGALSAKDRMKIFLRCVSDPGYQNGVGEEKGVHQSTVSKVIKNVTEKIIEKADTWVKFPQSVAEFKAAQENWSQKYEFPYAIGAIDCTHVRIQKLKDHHGDEYVNRKGLPSINVQATCDVNEMFTSIDAQWPGSVHDSRIFKNSAIYTVLQTLHCECLLLGDDGYPLRPWLMTPWRNPDTEMQKHYNEIICRERVIIERCFGQLKARFPILQYKVRLDIQKIPSIIVSCAVLHNVSKHLKDEDFAYSNQEEENSNINNNIQGCVCDTFHPVSSNLLCRLSAQRRQDITNSFA